MRISRFDANAHAFFGKVDNHAIARIDFLERACHQFLGFKRERAPFLDVACDANGIDAILFERGRNGLNAMLVAMIGKILDREKCFHGIAA